MDICVYRDELHAFLATSEAQSWRGLHRHDVAAEMRRVCSRRLPIPERYACLRRGPTVDREEKWLPGELAEVVPQLVAEAAPNADIFGLRSTATA